MDKICVIYNGPFSWILKVDGNNIKFEGSSAAGYFFKHFNYHDYRVLLGCATSNQLSVRVFRQTFEIPNAMVGVINGKVVEDTYILKDDDLLEFV